MSYSSRAHIVPMTSGPEGCDGTWVESLTSPDHQKVCITKTYPIWAIL